MKKAKTILLSFVFVVSASVGYCGTVDFSYEVGTWQGFRKAAITYSFDDNCYNQYLRDAPGILIRRFF